MQGFCYPELKNLAHEVKIKVKNERPRRKADGVSLRSTHTLRGSMSLNSTLRTLYFQDAASGGECTPRDSSPL